MTARGFLDASKRIEEALNHPALPLDYAGQGWLRRADKAGDDVETFITIPSGDPLGGGLYEGDLIGQAVQDSLIGAKDALPKMRAALEAVLDGPEMSIQSLAYDWMKHCGYTPDEVVEAERWVEPREPDVPEDYDGPPEAVRDLNWACEFAREVVDAAVRRAIESALTEGDEE